MATKKELQAQLALNKKINEALATGVKNLKEFQTALSALDPAALGQVNAILEETYGKQKALLTSAEELQAITAAAAGKEAERVKLLERMVDLQGVKSKAATKERAEIRAAVGDHIKNATTAQKELDISKNNLKVANDHHAVLSQTVKIHNDAYAVTQNQLESTLAIKNASGDMSDILIDSVASGESLATAIGGAAKAYEDTFTKANMAKTLKNQLKDLADEAQNNIFSADGLLTKYQQLDATFAQSTGLSLELGNEIKSLTHKFRDQHFTMEETNRAFETLAVQSATFTRLSTEGRTALAEQALQFSRLGVSADTFADSVDGLNKIFGNTPGEINKTTEELSNFGRALGVGPNKMLKNFNAQLPLLARYGKKQGVAMFKELATTAHLAGVEMSDLVGIAKQFDTFEDAAEAAGKLNFMLGGPLLNSVELLNASETDRIKMLKESVSASGKAFEDMGRFEKDLIAKTLGVDVSVAQKLFSDKNLNSIEEATAAIEAQAAGVGSLGDQAAKATTPQQEQAAAQEKMLETVKELGPVMENLQKIMAMVTGIMAEYGPYILAAQYAFEGLIAITSIWQAKSIAASAATTAAAVTGEGAKAAAITATGKKGFLAGLLAQHGWLPFIAIGALVVGALWLIYDNWEFIKNGIVDGFSALLDGLKALLKGWLTLITYMVEGFVQIMFLPLSALVEGAAWILDKIPGMGGTAGALKSFSPARIIHGFAGQMRGAIEGFEGGVTNFKGGAAVVGEGGPEIVTLPKGSNVVTNENVNRLMGENKAAAAAAPVEQTLNLILKLDGDVLAKHTRKISFDTMTKIMEFA